MRLALYLLYWKLMYDRSGLEFSSKTAYVFTWNYFEDVKRKRWSIYSDIRYAIKQLRGEN